VRGEIKPYFVTNPSAIQTDTLAVSIADSIVFKRALFSGTRASYTCVVHFLASVLRSLEPNLLSPPLRRNFTFKQRASPDTPPDFPRNISLYFGTHRTSILTPLGTRRTPPFLPDCKASTRQHIASTYTSFPNTPLVFSFPTFDYQPDDAAAAEIYDP